MDRVDYQPLLIQDILNLRRSEELDVAPWFQRRSIWNTSQKSYLINTLFEDKPIPALYIRYHLDLERGKTVRQIVDGQQRTRTILEYCEDGFSARHPSSGERRLFSQLNRTEKESFLLTAISVGYLLGASDADVIDIFGRINSVSKSLNAQEKRNSRYSGEFKQFCLRQASTRVELWRTYNIFSGTEIGRMSEVQFISDLVVNLMGGLSDFRQTTLGEAYKTYDEEFPESSDLANRLDKVFDFLTSLEPSSIKDTIFRRQPILFSLILVLDSLTTLNKNRVQESLYEIDSRFNSVGNQTTADANFITASVATTQRIGQRRVRDGYLRSYIK